VRDVAEIAFAGHLKDEMKMGLVHGDWTPNTVDFDQLWVF
jgi:hypothetical protein